MLEGAVIALVFLAVGVVAGRRSRKRVWGSGPATCACGHVRSMHVDGTGRCMHIAVDDDWWLETDPVTMKQVRRYLRTECPCQLYDGPEPLQELYAKEIKP